MTANVLDPTTTYVHLSEGPEVTSIPVTDDFWATIGQRDDLNRGRLVTSFTQTESWPTWEMHPAGDELILAVSGRFTFHLDDGSTTSTADLVPGQLLVVPPGTWHTADVHEPGQIVVITWGEGTAIRERQR